MLQRTSNEALAVSSYRPDIDGLRAIAVLAVVAYHYGVGWLPGGFAGVDVFFVISGYLITRGLSADIARGGFWIGRFYERRIRRLLPALLTVVGAVLIAGYLMLMPGDLVDLGRSTKFSAFGFGNVYFYRNTGYFDREAEFLPLLHLWSLGVEEQFYLAWPIILGASIAMTKGAKAAVASTIALFVLASMAFAQYQLATDPQAAFYLPFARAWELAIGAILAFTPTIKNRTASTAMVLVGLALIAASCIFVDIQHPFPGMWAIPSVIGAALIVQPRSVVSANRLLATPLMSGVGKISYSLYLWHWPVFVLYRIYIIGGEPTVMERSLLLLASIGLAWFTWAYVEPLRYAKLSTAAVLAIGAAAILIFVGAGNFVVRDNGFPSRVRSEAVAISSRDIMWTWDCPATVTVSGSEYQFCSFGADWETAKTQAVVWGDSHAQHLAPILSVLGREHNTGFILQDTCPAALGGSIYREWPLRPTYPQECRDIRKRMLDVLTNNPRISTVVLPSAWAALADYKLADDADSTGNRSGAQSIGLGLTEIVRDITTLGRRVIIVGNVPGPIWDQVGCEFAAISGLLRRQCSEQEFKISAPDRHQYIDPTEKEVARVTEQLGATAIRPMDGMCDDATCINRVDGQYIYRDGSHIRRNLSDDTYRHLATRLGLLAIFE